MGRNVEMNRIIEETLNNKGENYILPFFWQHGESEQVLREYMGAISACGIREVCVEARGHQDFAGPGWWKDMDVILDEAKNRGMRVWILDDAHFPTGQAAGRMKYAATGLRKQYLNAVCVEVSGPLPQAQVMVEELTAPKEGEPYFEDDSLFAVTAVRMLEGDLLSEEILDLTDKVQDGVLEWDVPEGMWRIFILYLTRNGVGDPEYINMLDEASCHVLIEAVYETHYERYGHEFGKTIAGFFSDEPCVGNTRGYLFDESIGRKNMPLPWSSQMPQLLRERLGEDYPVKLTALFGKTGSQGFRAKVRYAYMDAATRLIEKSFAGQLGSWCSEHNVEYIGHIIEDGNMHSRLGCSQGHFFRAMRGQHMSGIDDIGNQVVPGGAYTRRLSRIAPEVEGTFYHYELGKLGSSLAHIDPKKKGRALCEIFGAYGWSLDTETMKYLTDHFLVRGINRFVPHAFSPKEYPDRDCPPHFYAGGKNPQYEGFGELMRYMNRMCHLFNHGIHRAMAALLYHGEAQWAGECMFDQTAVRELLDHQIDLDIIPADVFDPEQGYPVEFDQTLKINGEVYETLVIPQAEFLPEKVLEFAVKAAKTGFPVIFLEQFPLGSCDGSGAQNRWSEQLQEAGCVCLPVTELSAYLRGRGIWDVEILPEAPQVHYYHYIRDGISFYMLQNENMVQTFEGELRIREAGKILQYDVMENRIYPPVEGTEHSVMLTLQPGESTVLLVGEGVEAHGDCRAFFSCEKKILETEWTVSAAPAAKEPAFEVVFQTSRLENFGKHRRDFSGYIRYETDLNWDAPLHGNEYLELSGVYGNVSVFVNGKKQGLRIAPPWRFPLEGLKQGKNLLCIQVATTLQRDARRIERENGKVGFTSRVFPPMGILGEVWIGEARKK